MDVDDGVSSDDADTMHTEVSHMTKTTMCLRLQIRMTMVKTAGVLLLLPLTYHMGICACMIMHLVGRS